MKASLKMRVKVLTRETNEKETHDLGFVTRHSVQVDLTQQMWEEQTTSTTFVNLCSLGDEDVGPDPSSDDDYDDLGCWQWTEEVTSADRDDGFGTEENLWGLSTCTTELKQTAKCPLCWFPILLTSCCGARVADLLISPEKNVWNLPFIAFPQIQ